jgi:hypothetical protein
MRDRLWPRLLLPWTLLASAGWLATNGASPASGQAAGVDQWVGKVTGDVVVEIVDDAGAVLPGVTVTVEGPGGTRSVTTDASGRVRVPGLPPGRYRLMASLQGFASAETSADVAVGQSSTVMMMLGGPVPVGVPSENGSGGERGSEDSSRDPQPAPEPGPAPAPSSTLEVLERTGIDDVALDSLLEERAASGWALESVVPLEDERSVFLFRRGSPTDCGGRVVASAFSADSLSRKLVAHAGRRIAGIHRLTPQSYAIVVCER